MFLHLQLTGKQTTQVVRTTIDIFTDLKVPHTQFLINLLTGPIYNKS